MRFGLESLLGYRLLGALFVCVMMGCSDAGREGATLAFSDVTQAAGIRFEHFQTKRNSLLPEDVGSGAAWGDDDNDGDDDFFLVNFSGRLVGDSGPYTNRLYRNDGEFQFTEVTAEAGLTEADWNTGCLWWDYNGDGHLDVAVSHFRGV